MTRYRADEWRGLHGFPEPEPASGTPANTVQLLRQALHDRGVVTLEGDVMRTAGGHYVLSLAPGLLVWSVPSTFRWFSAGCMILHPSADPTGAADLLVELFDRQPWLRYQRECLEALMEPAEASPV